MRCLVFSSVRGVTEWCVSGNDVQCFLGPSPPFINLVWGCYVLAHTVWVNILCIVVTDIPFLLLVSSDYLLVGCGLVRRLHAPGLAPPVLS